MMRCAIPINERQQRESVVVSVSMLLRVGGVDDQLDHGNTSPMIQRPVTPYDIVMQHLHRGGRERRKPRV